MALGPENARVQSWEHKLDDMGTDGPRLISAGTIAPPEPTRPDPSLSEKHGSPGRPAPGHLCDESQRYVFHGDPVAHLVDEITGGEYLVTVWPDGSAELAYRTQPYFTWGPPLHATRQH